MARRRSRRDARAQALLPLRSTYRLPNSLSCWFCDFKIYGFNDCLFSFGRRYARFLKAWFAIGVAFSVVALAGVVMLLLWEFAGVLHLHGDTFGFTDFQLSWLCGTSPLVDGLSLSVLDAGILFFCTLISITFHELGHAIAATSAGLQIEYIAIFLAILFPGALVAFNYDLLQSLPYSTGLRIYCAGIWHNAVCCAACGLVMLLLPWILSPLYMHGEGLMVLAVPQMSPLSGYLTHGDVILTVDGANVSSSYEWKKMKAEIDSPNFHEPRSVQNLHSSPAVIHRKGYCVPNSWIEGSLKLQATDHFSCPDELAAFVNLHCCNSSSCTGDDIEGSEMTRESRHCLNAKDVVKLKKCGNGWMMAGRDNCLCAKEESCMKPVQIPGMSWVEVSYSSPYSSDCGRKKNKPSAADSLSAESESTSCGGTFVFVGDVLPVANSLQLSSYRPRWAFMIFSAYIPTILEKILACTFHVSATLGFFNSLPVFFLDGESILETGLCYITWLNPRRRRIVLQFCLAGGTLCSIIVFLKVFYLALMIHN